MFKFRSKVQLPVKTDSRALTTVGTSSKLPALTTRDTSSQLPVAVEPVTTISGLDDDVITGLKRTGVKCIYGVFDDFAWSNTIMDARLYSMPLAARARAYTAPIANRAHALRNTSGFSFTITDFQKKAFDLFVKEGRLLTTLFPIYKEPDEMYTMVGISFPQPPRSEMQIIQRAQLAGFHVRAAVPGTALSVRYEGFTTRRGYEVDPIIFARCGNSKTVVLGYYNASPNDDPALKSLVEILESNKQSI